MKNWMNAEFEWKFRRWKVVNFDDTDELWICQSTNGEIRYFSSKLLEEIFP